MINWTPEMEQFIKDCVAEKGMSLSQTADEVSARFGVDCTRNAVSGRFYRKRMHAEGIIKEAKPRQGLTGEDAEKFRDMYERGMTYAAIGKEFDRNQEWAKKERIALGIEAMRFRERSNSGEPTPWTQEEKDTLLDMVNENCTLEEIYEALPNKNPRQVLAMQNKWRMDGILPDDGYAEDVISGAEIDTAKIMRQQGHSWEMIAIRLRRFTVEEIREACEDKIKEFCR